MNLAASWYVPAEVGALRRWLPAAGLANLLVLCGEWVRRDPEGMWLTALGMLALLGTRLVLPDGTRRWRRGAAAMLAGTALLAGVLSLTASDFRLYDFWSRAWLAVPGALALFWLLRAPVATWAAGGLDAQLIEAGLKRNRTVGPRLASVGLHTLLLHAAALIVIPVVWILDVALSPGNALGGRMGDAFTLEHFGTVLGDGMFWLWARNSLLVAGGTTLLGLALAIPAGYAYSRYDFAGRKGLMFVFILVQMFPGIVILVPYFMVMKTLDLLNTSIGLIVVYSVTALPLCVWMLKGYFDAVPRETEEAAILDGCTQLQLFLWIVLPLALPGVAMTALFSALVAWNEFMLALVFNTSNEQYTLPVGLASMIPSTGQRWGDFAAASVVVSVPVVVLFIFFQKALIRGLSAGAIKG